MGISYSKDVDEDTTAKAIGRDRHVSKKDSVEVARYIKGMQVDEARESLENVIEGDEAVPFKKHNSDVGHRKNIDGWDAGRYPEKAASEMLKVLENAASNADYQGFDADEMYIEHVAAHKTGEARGTMPRAFGRASPANTPIVDIEMILKQEQENEEAETEGDD
ncbi:MAG: 50S ribosomal protein L22 [Halobacteria archaeon]|nr:50S ribosomal protein L22 [Halobacteria archaeon]